MVHRLVSKCFKEYIDEDISLNIKASLTNFIVYPVHTLGYFV